jgi:acid phosphatase family membrane protein YuiD
MLKMSSLARCVLSISYAAAPIVGWLAADVIKSMIKSMKARKFQFELLSYGGLPSSHATVVCTTASLIGARAGTDSPEFALALTIAILFIVDAMNLRQWVGQHAKALNVLRAADTALTPLRERVGHKPIEILAGIALGMGCGYLLNWMG